jgi:hypothetical protein
MALHFYYDIRLLTGFAANDYSITLYALALKLSGFKQRWGLIIYHEKKNTIQS